jgi:dihydroneopterin triphosphate diphosphatase
MKLRYDMVNCYVVRPGELPRTHELLQLRRAPGEVLAGAWSVIRGGIEKDETAWQAALRELREETGLRPIEFYQLDTIDLFYLASNDGLWHVPGFCAVVERDAVITLNEEHDAFRWVTRDRIDADFLWPGERAQLAELCREILDDGPAKRYLRIVL